VTAGRCIVLSVGVGPGDAAGVAAAMDAAERHGMRLVAFCDWCGGDEDMERVARGLASRGHDVQPQAGPHRLPAAFWSDRGLPAWGGPTTVTAAQAAALLDWLAERHREVTGREPAAFRSATWQYGPELIAALPRHGIRIDASCIPARGYDPVGRGALRPFAWDAGCLELPVACVDGFRNLDRVVDLNLDVGVLGDADRLMECAERYFTQQGDDAIAVLVAQASSLGTAEVAERFDALLGRLGAAGVAAITTEEILEREARGELALGPTVTLPGAAPVRDGAPMCPVCGTPAAAFDGERRCPGCGGVERQRVFAVIYEDVLHEEFDLAGRRVLAVSPSVSERRLLERWGVEDLTTADIRPEVSPDLVVDVCHMPEVPRHEFDCVIASYVLTCVYDLEAALMEFHRVLRPGGRLLVSDPLAFGHDTEEYTDEERITGWYGSEAYARYRVGSFRRLGDEGMLEALSRGFLTKTFYGRDPITQTKVVWHSATRRVRRPAPRFEDG
jgi:SAM-dependent methyltransferase